jgi:hypothetical protein
LQRKAPAGRHPGENGEVHTNGLENFRGYAKRRLKACHGGFKRSFRLFIREMGLRFNQRNDPGMAAYPTPLDWSMIVCDANHSKPAGSQNPAGFPWLRSLLELD